LPVCRIGRDIAAGLYKLHPTVIHRDLKPANVLLDKKGAWLHLMLGGCIMHRVTLSQQSLALSGGDYAHAGVAKISDFGMARFKQYGNDCTKNADAGTVAYMAPECFERREITPKAVGAKEPCMPSQVFCPHRI
jgi:serine/threonine protein kinase